MIVLPFRTPPESECWEWTGKQYPNGYGQHRPNRRLKAFMAHRVVYELLVGPIPQGLDLDHLCRNRLCVNPEHLEPVTRSVNIRRGVAGANRTAWAATRRFCAHGHRRSLENTYRRKPSGWGCRVCDRLAGKRWRDSHPEAHDAAYWRAYRRRRNGKA